MHIVADATTSRTQEDRLLAFEVKNIIRVEHNKRADILKAYF